MKLKKMLILVVLLVFFAGVACASEVRQDNNLDEATEDIEVTSSDSAIETKQIMDESTTEKQSDNKEIKKENMNIKTSGRTYDVNSYDTLNAALTSSEYDNVTININSNIVLNGAMSIDFNIKHMIINGNQYTIDGSRNQFLIIPNGCNVTISNLNIKNCRAQEGGVIYNEDTLTLKNCNLNNNYAYENGGAIYNKNMLTVTNSILNNNTAGGQYARGGAIYNDGGATVIINDSTLNYNTAIIDGGCIYNYYEGRVTINNSSLNYNTAKISGGTVFNENYGTLIINDSVLNNNNASSEGGALYNYRGTVSINNSTLNKNIAHDGGAIYNDGTLSITDSTLNDNNASGGGAVYNQAWNLITITSSILNNNIAQYGGAIYNYGTLDIKSSILNDNTANITGGAVDNSDGIFNITSSTLINNTANRAAAIFASGYTIIEDNVFKTNKANMTGSVIFDYKENAIIKDNLYETNSKYSGTIYANAINITIIKNIFYDEKIYTNTRVYTTKGVIGNTLTLKATITDSNNKKVANGYVIFKLNGITIKDNRKLTGSTGNLKVYVKDGVASVNLTADLNMRHAKNLTAVYAGSTTYNASRSNTATAEIALRNATITLTTSTKVTKQGQNITLKATVKDTLRKNTNLEKYDDQYVFFKINGITLKDTNGKTLQAKIVNGTASTVYTVPLALSGVTDCKTMTPRNHTVTAGFVNPNYYPTARSNNTFQVERSNITINFENVTINNKTHKMTVKANIKDYLGNYVKGPNKYIIKINGATLKNATKTLYFQANNGIINIKDITIPVQQKYTTIEIVTQDRLGYKNQRNTTTKINLLN